MLYYMNYVCKDAISGPVKWLMPVLIGYLQHKGGEIACYDHGM